MKWAAYFTGQGKQTRLRPTSARQEAEIIAFSDNNWHISQTVGLRCCAAIIPGGAAPIDREQAAPPYPLHRLSLGIGISHRNFNPEDLALRGDRL